MTVTALSAHALFSGGHVVPLWWCRIPLLVATVGLSCVCIAVGVQALDRSSKWERSVRDLAESTGATIMFDMNDIKATSAVLTVVAFLLAIASLVFSVSLISDYISYLKTPRPDDITAAKEHSLAEDDEKTHGAAHVHDAPPLPFSTRTLGVQTLVLSFLSVWLLSVLIPSTLFSRTRSAHLTIQTSSPDMAVSVDPVYWDYGFLRCLAAAPWFSLVFSAPASIVSWAAWRFLPTQRRA